MERGKKNPEGVTILHEYQLRVFHWNVSQFPSTLSFSRSEKAWVLKLGGAFESLRGEETKKLGNNFKGT